MIKFQWPKFSFQPTPVDSRFVEMCKSSTPDDYPKRWSGLSTPLGSVIAKEWSLQNPGEWQEVVSGVSRQDTLTLAAQALAGMYQRALANKVDNV